MWFAFIVTSQTLCMEQDGTMHWNNSQSLTESWQSPGKWTFYMLLHAALTQTGAAWCMFYTVTVLLRLEMQANDEFLSPRWNSTCAIQIQDVMHICMHVSCIINCIYMKNPINLQHKMPQITCFTFFLFSVFSYISLTFLFANHFAFPPPQVCQQSRSLLQNKLP